MEYESEAQNTAQNMSFSSIESTQSNLLSEISITSYRERLESEDSEVEEFEIFEGLENFEEPEKFEELENTKSEFPNEAYKDLMLLITKHKLTNRASNAIIHFFNKHSNLPKSPLPKNIEKGREFMNKMNFPNLTFNKICITRHNGKEYFLYYQNLIHCIKHILAVPEITKDFALSFDNYEVGCVF